jgi:hypothetical protein
MAVALALTGRADAHALFARQSTSPSRRDALAAAERDYAEAERLMARMEQEGAVDGTDRGTLERIRKDLESVRTKLKTKN